MLQCQSSLKQINFKMECFSSLSDKPPIYYKYRGDLLQHSVVYQNNETQSRNSRAVALSTHARLRFNSSMSSLLGAFDSLFGFVSFVLNSLLGIARQWCREKFAILTLKPGSHVRIYRTWAILRYFPWDSSLIRNTLLFGAKQEVVMTKTYINKHNSLLIKMIKQ